MSSFQVIISDDVATGSLTLWFEKNKKVFILIFLLNVYMCLLAVTLQQFASVFLR